MAIFVAVDAFLLTLWNYKFVHIVDKREEKKSYFKPKKGGGPKIRYFLICLVNEVDIWHIL